MAAFGADFIARANSRADGPDRRPNEAKISPNSRRPTSFFGLIRDAT
jgi:hypothetical protein